MVPRDAERERGGPANPRTRGAGPPARTVAARGPARPPAWVSASGAARAVPSPRRLGGGAIPFLIS